MKDLVNQAPKFELQRQLGATWEFYSWMQWLALHFMTPPLTTL